MIAPAILAISDKFATAFTATTRPFSAPTRRSGVDLGKQSITRSILSLNRKRSSKKRTSSGLSEELHRGLRSRLGQSIRFRRKFRSSSPTIIMPIIFGTVSLRSVSRTYPDIECIVVDDHSSDDSVERIDASSTAINHPLLSSYSATRDAGTIPGLSHRRGASHRRI